MDEIITAARAVPAWIYVVLVALGLALGWASDWYDERQGLKRL